MSSFENEVRGTALPLMYVGMLGGLLINAALIVTGIGAIYLLKHRWYRVAVIALCGIFSIIAYLGHVDKFWLPYTLSIFLIALCAEAHAQKKEKEQAQINEALARNDCQEAARLTTDPRMRRILEAAARFDQMIDREAEKHRKHKAPQQV